MKITKLFIIALASLPFFYSCTNDEDVPVAPIPGAYENGFFVLNEGNSTAGSVTFVSDDLNKAQQNIYTAVNPSDGIGGFVQSIFFNGDLAYIISNGSNKITIVNRYTFKRIGKIETGLTIPRYGVVANGKAYVTNANTYGYTNPTTGDTDDFIAVINLTTNTVERTIPLNTTADKLVFNNGKIYIIEPFVNNKILVLNTTSNTLETPIIIGSSANSLELNNGNLYVLRAPSVGANQLVKVNLTTNLFTTIDLPVTQTNAQNLDIDNSKIYYSDGLKIYAMNITDVAAATTPLFTSTASSIYGMAVNKGSVFLADPVDYTVNGKAFIHSSSTGVLQKTIDVGLNPNGFYFN
jgi:hypothetical protein